jgi:hypothetical protein
MFELMQQASLAAALCLMGAACAIVIILLGLMVRNANANKDENYEPKKPRSTYMNETQAFISSL